MACWISIIAAFLACASAVSAVLAPFPHGRTTVYQYHTEVNTKIGDKQVRIEKYASQFVLQGTLAVTHYTRDPDLENAYIVDLSNVTTELHNGMSVDYDAKQVSNSIDSAAKVIEEPFLIIYYTNGTLQGIKIDDKEPEWSKNMKMAMASMLQLDLAKINMENSINVNQSFNSQERTIHGDCPVQYNVHTEDSTTSKEFHVDASFSSMDCDGFVADEFNNVDKEPCKNAPSPHTITDSSRNYIFEKQGDGILIRRLIVRSNIMDLSSKAVPYSTTTYTRLSIREFEDKSENDTPQRNFIDSPIIHDLSYRQPHKSYVPNASVDVTQGRHVVNLSSLPLQLVELLVEAIDYINDNNFVPHEVNWNRTQTINTILRTMSYMDTDGLQATFDIIEKMVLPRGTQMKNIFLGVVSQVGTSASCNFTRNVILKNNISSTMATDMLNKLPFHVKVPTTELLTQVEDLTEFNDSTDVELRKAGILSFSSLVYKTFKHVTHPEENTILKKYLNDFFDHVKNEPTYEMKVVYLMAIKNIQVGKIYNLLEPIINGSLPISEKPEQFRFLAIWAINKAVEEDYSIAERILWPVMVNKTLPTKLRISAYEILMNQAPDENSILRLHEYVSSEGNEHFYNYHYTTLDSIAKSVDKCKANTRKIVRSTLEKTYELLSRKHSPRNYHPTRQENIHYPLSGVKSINFNDNWMKRSEKVDIDWIVDEFTGQPEVLQLKHVLFDKDGSASDVAIRVHVEGTHDIIRSVLKYANFNRGLIPTKTIQDFLEKLAKSLKPTKKEFHLDIVLMRHGRVFKVNHYNFETFENIVLDVVEHYYAMLFAKSSSDTNYQNVIFDRLYQKQMICDIGVPVIMETRIPIVNSLKFKNLFDLPLPRDVAIELKTWIHGDYSMSVYNPLKDAWHSVRSLTITEVSLPLRTTISQGVSRDSLRFSFPKQPDSVSSIAAVIVRGSYLVTVDEDRTRALIESCPTCRDKEPVHVYEETDSKTQIESIDSKDTGLKLSRSIYNCEYAYRMKWRSDYIANWDDTYISNITNSWSDALLQGALDVRRMLKNMVSECQTLNCGGVFTAEPSSNYSFSHIEVNLHGYHEIIETTIESLHAEKHGLNVTVDMVSSLTNTTAKFWNFDANVDSNRGHLENNASVRITRKTPEEEDFKICLDAKKNYPEAPEDELKIAGTIDEVNSKLNIAYGYTNKEECATNGTLVSITSKAQLSDEQKERLKYDLEHSACSKDIKDPLYANPSNLVPRTINCLNEAIRYTTPRKYSVDVTYDKLSLDVVNFIYRALIFEDFEPSESGNLQFQATFPEDTSIMDFKYNFTNTTWYLKNLLPDSHGPEMYPLWDYPLDNSRFSQKYLCDYIWDDIRICSVFPRIVLTDDGRNMQFAITNQTWTLVSGNHDDKMFAIFAKQPRPNYLSFLVFIQNHVIHFFTREIDNVFVAVVDGVRPEKTTGFQVPDDEPFSWIVKVKKRHDHFVVRLRSGLLTLLVGPNYISVEFNSELQGHVSGLCGYLDGTSINGTTDIYSINDIDGY